jgi:Glycosyl transferase family 2
MSDREEVVGSPSSDPAAVAVSLSLVIPAYNEGLRLKDGLSRLSIAIAAGAIDPGTTEFVVVDDGSTDDTTAKAHDLFSSFPHVLHVRLPQNHGKGAAVRAGVAMASAPIIAFADADMAIDPGQTPQFIRSLADADLAIGSRAASGATVNRPSLRRSVMNRAFNRLVNVVTRVALDDTQCGFKAFRAPAAKLLFHCSVTERFAFDVEILSLARRLGLPIAEVPVQWMRVGGSQIRPWTDARSMARDVFHAGRGGASALPVPTLTVRITRDGRETGALPSLSVISGALPPGLPVLSGDGAVLVLCPLMDENAVVRTETMIRAAFPDVEVGRTELTVAQLSQLSPVKLTWDDGAIARQVHQTPSAAIVGRVSGA